MTRHTKYGDRCGTCKYFSFYEKNGEIRKQGRCNNQKRVNYHQASQKACKLYKDESEGYMKYKKWIDTGDTAIINGVDVNILMCPKCESRVIVIPMDNSEANFCPNCGADLRDEEQRESEEMTREDYIEILKQYKEKPTLINEISSVEEAVWLDEALDAAIKALEQEPKTGHWIFDDECEEHGHCSRCGYGSVDLVDGEPHIFCRRCGAKMVEPQEREVEE